MIGITNYIKHDLEGVFTAELARGCISMLLAVIISSVTDFADASAYVLIVALYGLRPLTGNTLFQRFINIILSLSLLIVTLAISMYFGHHQLYFWQTIFCIVLSSATVYALAKVPAASGTVMFMSVFSIVNFGMGMLDTDEAVKQSAMIEASLYGALCVIASVLLVPVKSFHWCLLINHCFYHELKTFCKVMSKSAFYDSFTDLPNKRKNFLLQTQSSLMNITSYVRDPIRRNHYQHILNGLMLISFWPTTGTDKAHKKLINNIRSATFATINNMLTNPQQPYAYTSAFIKDLEVIPCSEFCNGEMIQHTIDVIKSLEALIASEQPKEQQDA